MSTENEPNVNNPGANVPDVSAELDRLLHEKKADGSPRWSFDDFQATFPPMIIHLMSIVPFLEMPPEGQELCLIAMGQIGLDIDATDEQINAAITNYLAAHKPNEELLAAIQGVLVKAFAENDARLSDASRKLGGQTGADVAAKTPKLGEKAPDGAVGAGDFQRQMQKKIPMR